MTPVPRRRGETIMAFTEMLFEANNCWTSKAKEGKHANEAAGESPELKEGERKREREIEREREREKEREKERERKREIADREREEIVGRRWESTV